MEKWELIRARTFPWILLQPNAIRITSDYDKNSWEPDEYYVCLDILDISFNHTCQKNRSNNDMDEALKRILKKRGKLNIPIVFVESSHFSMVSSIYQDFPSCPEIFYLEKSRKQFFTELLSKLKGKNSTPEKIKKLHKICRTMINYIEMYEI